MVDGNEKVIKIVFVGENNTGKSEIIKKYLNLESISKPTIFDTYRIKYVYKKNAENKTYAKNKEYTDNFNIFLNICDTSGSEEVERLVKMSYLDADMFVLCIECTDLKDNVYYQNIINNLNKSGKSIILAVTKVDKAKCNTTNTTDLQDENVQNSVANNFDVVNLNAKEIVKKYKLTSYILVSSKRKKSINAVFDEAVRIYFTDDEVENAGCYNCFGCCM